MRRLLPTSDRPAALGRVARPASAASGRTSDSPLSAEKAERARHPGPVYNPPVDADAQAARRSGSWQGGSSRSGSGGGLGGGSLGGGSREMSTEKVKVLSDTLIALATPPYAAAPPASAVARRATSQLT